jgi:hypothetical protein
MAKNKKKIEDQPLVGCDFCMQWDMDDPHVIAATDNPEGFLEIKVTPVMDGGIVFQCPTTNKKLRIFARPLTDAGRAILETCPIHNEKLNDDGLCNMCLEQSNK